LPPILFSGHAKKGAPMLDDSQRLRENHQLLALLSHYAKLGTEDRETWRDRLMQVEGFAPKELSALHGELIAFDWIEQNTGQALLLKDGTISACYRITLLGLRECRRVQEGDSEIKETQPRIPRKKKGKTEAVAVANAR
jgi:hypothetical protein